MSGASKHPRVQHTSSSARPYQRHSRPDIKETRRPSLPFRQPVQDPRSGRDAKTRHSIGAQKPSVQVVTNGTGSHSKAASITMKKVDMKALDTPTTTTVMASKWYVRPDLPVAQWESAVDQKSLSGPASHVVPTSNDIASISASVSSVNKRWSGVTSLMHNVSELTRSEEHTV